MSFICHLPDCFNHKKINLLAWWVASVISCAFYADDALAEVAFDPIFLDQAAGGHIDVSKFNGEYKVPAGTYAADIYLNNRLLGRENVTVREVKGKSIVCFTPTLVALTGLRTGKISTEQMSALRQENSCTALETLQPSSSAEMLLSDMRLNINIPQAISTVPRVVRLIQAYGKMVITPYMLPTITVTLSRNRVTMTRNLSTVS